MNYNYKTKDFDEIYFTFFYNTVFTVRVLFLIYKCIIITYAVIHLII